MLPIISRKKYNTDIEKLKKDHKEEIEKIEKQNSNERFQWLQEKSELTDKTLKENEKLKSENQKLNIALEKHQKTIKDLRRKVCGIGGYKKNRNKQKKIIDSQSSEITKLKEELESYKAGRYNLTKISPGRTPKPKMGIAIKRQASQVQKALKEINNSK